MPVLALPSFARFWFTAERLPNIGSVWQRHHHCLRAEAVLQDVASYEATQETLALLKVLALGQQEVAAGKVKPLSDVVARLKTKRIMA